MKESETTLEVMLVANGSEGEEPYTCTNCGFEYGFDTGETEWVRYCMNCGGKVVGVDHKEEKGE